MPGRTPLDQLRRIPLRRIPPGLWAAVIWCAYAADSLRPHSGIPGQLVIIAYDAGLMAPAR